MNKLMQILKSKKGFTLMEVIIVVIILAVLAAALIPTFLGFVEQSRHATAIAEARLGMTAAQAVVTEAVGRGTLAALNDNIENETRFIQIILADGIPGVTADNHVTTRFSIPKATYLDGTRINGLVYNQGPGGFTVTIAPGTGAVVTAGS